MFDSFQGRVLLPSDRFRLACSLRDARVENVYSLSLLVEAMTYYEIWHEAASDSFVPMVNAVLMSCIEKLTLGSRLEQQISRDVRQQITQLEALTDEWPTASYPLSLWLFPECVRSIAQSIWLPQYWKWFENRVNCLSWDEIDAGGFLCMIHLSRKRRIEQLEPGKSGRELIGLDTTEATNDVCEYWESHLKQAQFFFSRTASEISIAIEQLKEQLH